MSIERYLAGYAEADSMAIAEQVTGVYQHALVVPLYDEAHDCVSKLLRHQPNNANLLVICVVNVPDNAPASAHERSEQLLRHLHGGNHLVIDRVTSPIPRRQGVGLARKLGNDVALWLYQLNKLSSPWFYQTDGDATLPSNYFSAPLSDRGATVFAHQHVSDDPQLLRAAQLYDLHMQRYMALLKQAGSRYAFSTLGSTIAVHAQDYAACRGFPKRNAAEDFYLLNKVAKLGGVTTNDTVTVEVQARRSDRVPFGTGPALTALLENLSAHPDGSGYLSYHPDSFALLAQALSHLQDYAQSPCPTPPQVAELLEELGINRVAEQITRRYADPTRRHQAWCDWFDGLRTLRFIHLARRWHPDQPLLTSVQELPESVRQYVNVPPWV